jgi:hypothetical protein
MRLVSVLVLDPFGEKPAPWWQRMWRRDRSKGAPKRYAVAAGVLGAFTGLIVTGIHGVDHVTKGALVAFVTALPSALLETWWKRQSRRRAERLLIVPEGEQQRLLTGDGA